MFNGILVFHKPKDFTSHDVVAKLRGITKQKKIGHGGTLDPMATGVLPIFLGNATKVSEYAVSSRKEYIVRMRLGLETDTQDITGTVIKTCPVSVSEQEVCRVLKNFHGVIEQLPPMFSAIKIHGERLYHLARRGLSVEREMRPVTIYDIKLLEQTSNEEYVLDVICSKGTYIRTLCHDIGQALGCGAVMTELTRICTGGFGLESSFGFEEVEHAVAHGTFDAMLIGIDRVFCHLPAVSVRGNIEKMAKNGVSLNERQIIGKLKYEDTLCRIYSDNGQLIMIGKICGSAVGQRNIVVEKMFFNAQTSV